MVIRDPWIRALVIIMLLIAAVYLTGLLWQVALQFADIILLFFLAWIISFILEPMVAALEAGARFPRKFAVLAVYVAVLILASAAIVQFVPRLSAQLIVFANDLPTYADWTNRELLRLQAWLADQGVMIAPESFLSYQEAARHVEALGPLLVANTVVLATGVANLLFQVVIVLILSYYLALDGGRISSAALLALPPSYRDDARYFIVSVNRAFAGFMRGQLVQALIYGLGTAAVMALAGLNLVLLPSVAAGAFMLLPFIGPFLAMVAPLVVAAVTKPEVFLPVLVALFVLQQLVVNVLAPRLMSRTVGIHPLLVFFGMLAGAKVAGIWGAVFGVPVVGVAATMLSFYRATLEDRRARLLEAGGELSEAGEPLAVPASGDVPAPPPTAPPEAAPSAVAPGARRESSVS